MSRHRHKRRFKMRFFSKLDRPQPARRADPVSVERFNTPTGRLLQVSTEFYVAGAVWEKRWGVWSCKLAAPILKWMIGKNADEVKLTLAKMGARWEWIERKLGPETPTVVPDQIDERKEPILAVTAPASGVAPLCPRPGC